MRVDPKPAKRIRARRPEWQRIVRAKEGPCRGCGEYPYVTFHHLVPRSLGGDDVEENVVPLCGDGLRGCHGALETRRRGWKRIAARVRENLTEEEAAYIVRRKSVVFLDEYLPEGSHA